MKTLRLSLCTVTVATAVLSFGIAAYPKQNEVVLPSWAKVRSVKTSFTRSGQCEVTLHTQADIPQKTQDKVSFCLYFYPPKSEVGVIFSLGDYPYGEEAPSQHGGVFRARIVHTNGGSRCAENYHWIAPLRASVAGNRVTLRFPSNLVSRRRPTYLVVRYIPANLPIRTHQDLYDSIANPQPEALAIDVRILDGEELDRKRKMGYVGINLSMFHP